MARRKNSAEMLDILRRMNRDQKARAPQPPQKSGATDAPGDEGRAGPAEPTTLRAPGEVQGLGEAGGRQETPFKSSRMEIDLKLKEGEGGPGRIRKAFLSVISGGRGAAVSPKEERVLPPFGDQESIDREEDPGRLPIAAGGREEPMSLAGPGRSRSKAAEAKLGGAAQTVGAAGSASLPREGAIAPHAEYAPLGPRSPFSPPEGGVKEWPGAAFSPAPPGIFSPRETAPSPPAKAGGSPEADAAALPAKHSPAASPTDPDGPHPAGDGRDGAGAPDQDAGGGPEDSQAEPWTATSRTAAPRRALFAASAYPRQIFSDLAGRLRGRAILAGLRKGFQVRMVTLGLYAVVAIGAMLLMAFILNPHDPGSRKNELPPDGPEADPVDLSALRNLEITPAGPGVPPPVRNVEQKAPAPQAPEAADTGAVTTEGGVRIDSSKKGQKGWYVQVRAFLNDKECELIIEHLKLLGYKSLWKQPNGKGFYWLLLGPYPTKKDADAEILSYKDLMAKNPLKKPKLPSTLPFVRPENR